MGLPNPIPDNPLKWDGWKQFSSANPYERLCLDFNPKRPASDEEIEEHCRLLLVWWQKKLPLKNQPSNPMAQLLRAGLDEAPAKLSEASSLLLNPETRRAIDEQLQAEAQEAVLAEFRKLLQFALTGGMLTAEEERSLHIAGEGMGLSNEEITRLVDEALEETGANRVTAVEAAPAERTPLSQREEFLRLLRLSGIDEMTDDQRDAFCNMGEALGLSGGDAEDIIDEYLEERMGVATAQPVPQPITVVTPPKPAAVVAPNPTREACDYPPFQNSVGMPMLLVPSGSFLMGSSTQEAAANERPVSRTNISAFYLARWPVTVGQYEQFDPAHRAKRAPWATEQHPVLFVSAEDAARFCEWLSVRERRRYRLPTEAEWEYAARGSENRIYPWGNNPPGGRHANFADANTRFPWADPSINDGYAETSPVGSYPLGVSPFGMEDMAGNVWEWCHDCLVPYTGRERTNPKGPTEGSKRICRGGSWKSRAGSLRTSARGFYPPNTVANDIGFRVLCEIF